MVDAEALLDNYRQELRRETVVLACLLALRKPGYGYGLLKTLESAGIPTEANTLYPLLRRLQTQGLLTSEWREEEKRNKRFYRLSAAGALILEQLLAEWNGINDSLHKILEDKEAKKER
jgi:PadR family transcriptional regulator PadR